MDGKVIVAESSPELEWTDEERERSPGDVNEQRNFSRPEYSEALFGRIDYVMKWVAQVEVHCFVCKHDNREPQNSLQDPS